MNSLIWFFSGAWIILLSMFLSAISKDSFLSPTKFIGISWGIMFFLSALQVIVFPPISLSAWLYLAIFVTVQVFGVFIGGLVRNKDYQNTTERQKEFNKSLASSEIIALICILGLVGIISSLYDSIILNDFDPSRLDLTRDVLNVIYSHKSSWINRISFLTQPFAWLSIILITLYSEHIKPVIRSLGYLILFGLISLGVASAGRTILIKIFLILFLITLARKSLGLQPWLWKWNLLTRSLSTIFMIGITYYFLNIWGWRVGGNEYLNVDIKDYFIYADESTGLKTFITYFIPDGFKNTFLLLIIYIFNFADNFALFYERVNIQPYWGLWQFFNFASTLSRFGFTDQTSDSIYLSVFYSFRSVGLWSAQWRTMAQEYIIDFGRVGALNASLFSGLVIGFVYKALRNGNFQWLALYIVLILCGIYGAYSSAINPNQFLLFIYCFFYGWIARKNIII